MAWWILTYWNNHPYPTSMHHWARTSYPDHLFMKWSTVRPTRSRILKNIRGKWVHCGYRYYWDTPNIAEQIEYGDTLSHHFYLPNLPPGSTIWFYLGAPGGPYGLEIQGPLCSVTLPLTFGWEQRVLVATKGNGIYYSQNFTGPAGDHPTWTRHNQGLVGLTVWQLHGDLYNPNDRQYALVHVNASSVLYRRKPHVEDYWRFILTDQQACTLTGATSGVIRWVATTRNQPGYVYALFRTTPHPSSLWCLRSPDEGTTWAAFHILTTDWGLYTGNLMCGNWQGTSPYPAGDVLYITYATGAVPTQRLQASFDNGETWQFRDEAMGWTASARCHVDPTDQSIVYMGSYPAGTAPFKLYRSEEHGANLVWVAGTHYLAIRLTSDPTPMWVHPTNHELFKVLRRRQVYQTWDYGLNWTAGPDMTIPINRLTIVDPAPAWLYLGRDSSVPPLEEPGWPHVVFASDDEGATLIGKCGPHAQFSDGGGDSIPYDCGGVAFDGILPLYSP